MHWLEETRRLLCCGEAHVLVTLISVEGSAPRAVGAKMVVSSTSCVDSVGGGNLEYQATLYSRELLHSNRRQIQQRSYTLGNDLSQCCGGRVQLMFEVFPRPKLNVVLFGGGHVGQSMATILSGIDCSLSWFDSRANYLPDQVEAVNTATQCFDNPYRAVELCRAGSSFLVMTHSHDIDFELVEAILSRSDSAFCGLIASKSKSAKFKNRLRRKGFSEQELARLVSPIGTAIGEHKEPMAVAVAIVAQLLDFSVATDAEEADHIGNSGSSLDYS